MDNTGTGKLRKRAEQGRDYSPELGAFSRNPYEEVTGTLEQFIPWRHAQEETAIISLRECSK